MKRVLLAAFTALSLLACNDTATNRTTASTDSAGGMQKNENDTKEAKEERNKQTALGSERAFENKGTVDDVFKDADKDFIEYGDGNMKPIKGIDSVKSFLRMWMTAMPDYRGSDFTAVADGDNVMVYGTWKGTWKNDMMGQKATGKSFVVKDVDFFKFNDAGKITEHRNVTPMSEIARQIGMKMPAETKQ